MVELSPEAKKLLAQMREVDNPTSDERASAHAAAQRMLRAQGLRTLPRLPAAELGATAASGGTSVKLVWGVSVVATLGLLAALAWRRAAPTPSAEVAHPRPPSAAAAQEEASV